jgi:hypothetical protein
MVSHISVAHIDRTNTDSSCFTLVINLDEFVCDNVFIPKLLTIHKQPLQML